MPFWTLHAAAEQDVRVPWIKQYLSGARRPNDGRADVVRTEQRTFDELPEAPPSRWKPERRTGTVGVG